ncbi:hypothetical protein EON81_23900 [bacterium]|nr:MAG: hypothetical protein EON81_23900 [bacterium]
MLVIADVRSKKKETFKLARKAIRIAVEGTDRKNFWALWTGGLVYMETGDYQMSFDILTEAEALCASSKEDMKSSLSMATQFKKRVRQKLADEAAAKAAKSPF